MIYALLFWEFFKVGIFCVGGGYAPCRLFRPVSSIPFTG